MRCFLVCLLALIFCGLPARVSQLRPAQVDAGLAVIIRQIPDVGVMLAPVLGVALPWPPGRCGSSRRLGTNAVRRQRTTQ